MEYMNSTGYGDETKNYPIWHDSFLYTKDRIVLTENELHIPALSVFGHHILHNAIPSLSWHSHLNTFEFSIPIQGTFSFSTQYNIYPFSYGDIFISFPNEVHGTNKAPITTGDLYWFQLDISDKNHFLFLNADAAESMITRLQNMQHHIAHIGISRLTSLIKRAFQLALDNKDCQMTSTMIQLLVLMILDSSEESSPPITPDIQKACDYIEKKMAENVTLEELSSISSLSCSQFKQKFKNQIGVAPRHYINNMKVECAKKLLEDGESVTETALALGFSTSSYFSSVFKKYTLYSPDEYRKKPLDDS